MNRLKQRSEELQQQALVIDSEEGAFEGCAVDTLHTDMQDIETAQIKLLATTNENELMDDYLKLNQDQRDVVDYVTKTIWHYNKQLLCFVSGEGGTDWQE